MKKAFITFLILFFAWDTQAQKNYFVYDEAGNRTRRLLRNQYNYYNYNSFSWPSGCKCIVTSTPQPSPALTSVWISFISVDGLLAWDFTDPLNASNNTPRGTITIKHLTDSQKFQKYSVSGNSTSTQGGAYYYMGSSRLLEQGSTPLADGDVVYLLYTIN